MLGHGLDRKSTKWGSSLRRPGRALDAPTSRGPAMRSGHLMKDAGKQKPPCRGAGLSFSPRPDTAAGHLFLILSVASGR